MNADEARQEYDRMLREEAARDRRGLALRLTGWVLLLGALLAVWWAEAL
ncbi:hypothetical protein GA0115251_106928 [Streptomyces sp. TverLS-915]|nr:hypothetical protein [Streptomyces sp. TverLS-915]SCD41038.1 hypothetical protein GA0115251_106928 [Streptomyces sp. TverLS-915]